VDRPYARSPQRDFRLSDKYKRERERERQEAENQGAIPGITAREERPTWSDRRPNDRTQGRYFYNNRGRGGYRGGREWRHSVENYNQYLANRPPPETGGDSRDRGRSTGGRGTGDRGGGGRGWQDGGGNYRGRGGGYNGGGRGRWNGGRRTYTDAELRRIAAEDAAIEAEIIAAACGPVTSIDVENTE